MMLLFFLSLLVNCSSAGPNVCQSCNKDFPLIYSMNFTKNKNLEEIRNRYFNLNHLPDEDFGPLLGISNTKKGKIFGANICRTLQSIAAINPENVQSVKEYLRSEAFDEAKYSNNDHAAESIIIINRVVSFAFSDINYLKNLFKYPDLFVEAFRLRKELVETLVKKLDPENPEDWKFLIAIIEKIGINLANEVVGTLLNVAVMEDKDELAQFLIEKGANVNSRNIIGITPVFEAIVNENFDLFKLLVAKGADLKIEDYRTTNKLWVEDSLIFGQENDPRFKNFILEKFKHDPKFLAKINS